MRLKVIIFCILCIAVSCRAADTPNDMPDEAQRLQFADGLYTRDMFELAADEYVVFLERFPKSKSADAVHFRLGECYKKMDKLSLADKEYRTVTVQYPQSEFRFKAAFRRADLFRSIGRHRESVDLLQMLVKENPPEDILSASVYYIGEAYISLENKDEACKQFEEVVSKYPGCEFYPFALLRLGDIYSEKLTGKSTEDDFKKVLDLYNKVIENKAPPRIMAEALFQSAELYFKMKVYEKSAEAYRSLMSAYPLDPRSAEARLRAAWAMHNAGRYADALKLADAKLAEGFESDTPSVLKPEWLYLKANCERQLVKSEDAIKTYTMIIDLFPEGQFAKASLYEKALTYYKMGKFENAVLSAEQIVPGDDNKKDVYWLLAESYAALGKQDESIQYYRMIVHEFPKSDVAADSFYRLAHNLQEKASFKEASQYYGMVYSSFPEHPIAANALFAAAYCFAKQDAYAEAVRDWSSIVRKYPQSDLLEESLYQKAMGEIRLKRDGDAIESLRELLEKFPTSKYFSDAHYWQAMLLKEAGKNHDAESEFRIALNSKIKIELAREAELHLAIVLQRNGKIDEAAGIYQTLVATPMSEKFSPELLQWLAEYRLEQSKTEDAMAPLKVLLDGHSDPVWQQVGYAILGRAYMASGEKEKAEAACLKAVGIDSKTRYLAESALRLGNIKSESGSWADAERYYSMAAEKAGAGEQADIRAQAYAGIAQMAEKSGDNEKAAKYYMSVAILYDEENLVAKCLYGAYEAFKAVGKLDAAQRALQELQERYPSSEWAKKGREKLETAANSGPDVNAER